MPNILLLYNDCFIRIYYSNNVAEFSTLILCIIVLMHYSLSKQSSKLHLLQYNGHIQGAYSDSDENILSMV